MECGTCGTVNAAEANFCHRCGVALARTCPTCGVGNPPDARFCNGCGGTLADQAPAATPSRVSGERRLVTVLFADLVGFTPLTERLDPEDVRSMLVQYFDRARAIVDRLGGEIEKYTGDAVTAFWGTRVAGENDAERAVRAGLELVGAVSALGRDIGIPDLQARAGVMTGETAVGPGGNATGMIVGDIVNTAARLQAIAEPGTVLVGDTTRRLAEDRIAFEPGGSHVLKGVTHPVETHRAVSPASRHGDPGRPVTGIEPPFVGRDFELRLLEGQVEATAVERRARLVSIVGDAGIGKSRLARELGRRGGVTTWLEGRSPSYGEGVTFWALDEMIRGLVGIGDGSDDGEARRLLEEAVAGYCPDDEERRWILPRLAAVLGLDPMPSGDRDDVFGAIRTFFQRVAEHGPAVLVFEDLHAADEGLLDFIVELVDRSPRHPVLVVTLARPSMLDRHPGWGASRRGFTSAHIGPLSDGDMEALVTGTVPDMDPETVGLIVGAAGGVPLYAVEYLRMLLASGGLARADGGLRQAGPIDALTLPESLQAMVGARLDRLDPDGRALVQDAAVLGQSFTLGELATATGRDLDALGPLVERLVRDGVFERDDDARVGESGRCRFVQATVREVAYRRLSREERKQRHLAVVDRLQDADALGYAGVIAGHYLSALEAKPDPELAGTARSALTSAARRAADLHANRQALELVARALEVPGDDAERWPLWELGARVASAVGDAEAAVGFARRVLAWHTSNGDAEGRTRARVLLATTLVETGASREAVEVLTPHFDPEAVTDPEKAWLGRVLAVALERSGDHARAAATARDVLVDAAAIGDPDLVVALLRTRGTSLHYLGRLHESRALLREAIRLASEAGSLSAEAIAIGNLIVVDGVSGRLRDLALPDRLRDLAARAASPNMERRAAIWTARILTARGDFEAARRAYVAIEDSEAGVLDYDRARIRFLDWVLDGDLEHLDESADLLGSGDDGGGGDPQLRDFELSALSQIAFAAGRPAEAFDLAQRADYASAVPHSFLFDVPVYAAMRLEDRDRLRTARANIPSSPVPRFASLRAVAEAAIGVVEDRTEDAARRLLEVAEHHATIDGPGDAAVLKAILAELLPDLTIAREAGRAAFEWYSAHGAVGYLHLFADVWDAIGVGDAR